MNSLQVRLFGKISIQQDGRPLPDLSVKVLELLCYLLVYRDRAHTRETLSDVLWPEASISLSKKYLRQSLWQLQAALENQPGCEQAEAETLLILNPGWVRINPQATWWLDVDVFEQAYALSRDIPGQDLTDRQAQALEEAVDLYQGDLMETWYQDWCIFERDRLQLTYLAMLEKLMQHCEARQWYTKGVAYGQGILRYDPARESSHRQLMHLYYRAGDRTTALRQYDRCAAALAKEFSLQPSHETVALYQQVRADYLEDTPRQTPLDWRPIDAPDSRLLLDLFARLDRLQTSLSAMQNQVRQELAAISRVLSRSTAKSELETPQQTLRETR